MHTPEREAPEAEGVAGAEVDDDKLAELQRALAGLEGVWLRRAEPLARHNTLRVGGPADLWCVVDAPERLPAVWAAASKAGVPTSIDYPLADRLIKAGGIGGLVIRPGLGFEGMRMLEGEDGPRLELGACTPFARAAVLGGTWAALGTWPGTPGAWLGGPRWSALADFADSILIQRGKTVTELPWHEGEPPPEPGPRGVLRAIRLRAPLSLRLHRPPPPTGTLFSPMPKVPGGVLGLLRGAGVLGSRLRAWRLEHNGALSQQGGGTTDDLLMFAKAIRARVHAVHGLEPEPFAPVVGRNPIRRSPRARKVSP